MPAIDLSLCITTDQNSNRGIFSPQFPITKRAAVGSNWFWVKTAAACCSSRCRGATTLIPYWSHLTRYLSTSPVAALALNYVSQLKKTKIALGWYHWINGQQKRARRRNTEMEGKRAYQSYSIIMRHCAFSCIAKTPLRRQVKMLKAQEKLMKNGLSKSALISPQSQSR